MIGLIHDFITERKAYVEIEEETSMMFSLDVGCPQGSTLGPKVFNIYCNDLSKQIEKGTLVTYADDSYVVIDAKDVMELKEVTEEVVKKHLAWLSSNGMVCNTAKTEMMALNCEPVMIRVGEADVETKDEMKVLGLIFDDKLNWFKHVSKAIQKSNRMLHGLRLLRRHLSTTQANRVVTAFFYSSLYYGIEVWFHRNLGFHLKKKIRSAHYRALRLVYGDHLSRDDLDNVGQRATPDELADYSIAKMIAKMCILEAPKRLLMTTLQNSYSERRKPGRLMFYDDSSRMIGRQRLKNRLKCVSKHMKFEWLHCDVNGLRPKLKKCFFNYSR